MVENNFIAGAVLTDLSKTFDKYHTTYWSQNYQHTGYIVILFATTILISKIINNVFKQIMNQVILTQPYQVQGMAQILNPYLIFFSAISSTLATRT